LIREDNEVGGKGGKEKFGTTSLRKEVEREIPRSKIREKV